MGVAGKYRRDRAAAVVAIEKYCARVEAYESRRVSREGLRTSFEARAAGMSAMGIEVSGKDLESFPEIVRLDVHDVMQPLEALVRGLAELEGLDLVADLRAKLVDLIHETGGSICCVRSCGGCAGDLAGSLDHESSPLRSEPGAGTPDVLAATVAETSDTSAGVGESAEAGRVEPTGPALAACSNSDHDGVAVPATQRIVASRGADDRFQESRCQYCAEGVVYRLLRDGWLVTTWITDTPSTTEEAAA